MRLVILFRNFLVGRGMNMRYFFLGEVSRWKEVGLVPAVLVAYSPAFLFFVSLIVMNKWFLLRSKGHNPTKLGYLVWSQIITRGNLVWGFFSCILLSVFSGRYFFDLESFVHLFICF